MRIQNDEPARTDRLGRAGVAKAFARLAEDSSTPLVVGLYGGWGSGKTSLMRQIEAELDKKRVRSIWFDPWKHQFDDAPALALLHTVVEALQLDSKVKKYLTVIAAAFSSALLKHVTPLTASDVDKLAQRYEEERFQIREARVKLQRYFEQVIEGAREGERFRLVFFIDDLDRCMPRPALDVLEALKLYFNLPGCIYFLGVDRTALEKSIKHCYADLDLSEASYLDKIVQVPFTIPPLPRGSLATFVEEMLPVHLRRCGEILADGLGGNPREVKRFVNTFIFADQLASALSIPNYEPRTLALLQLIQYRSPRFYKAIVSDHSLLLEIDPEHRLWKDMIASDEGLPKVLESTRPAAGEDLSRYFYLTEVSGLHEISEPRRDSEKIRKVKHKPSGEAYAQHQMWLRSGGNQGKRLSSADVFRGDRDHRDAVLTKAILDAQDLRSLNLSGADLSGASLRRVNLHSASLRAARLLKADLEGARMMRTNIREADFSGANLSGAVGIRAADLAAAITDVATVLPDGSYGPFVAGRGAHLPAQR
jgi:hypothetical protein